MKIDGLNLSQILECLNKLQYDLKPESYLVISSHNYDLMVIIDVGYRKLVVRDAEATGRHAQLQCAPTAARLAGTPRTPENMSHRGPCRDYRLQQNEADLRPVRM